MNIRFFSDCDKIPWRRSVALIVRGDKTLPTGYNSMGEIKKEKISKFEKPSNFCMYVHNDTKYL